MVWLALAPCPERFWLLEAGFSPPRHSTQEARSSSKRRIGLMSIVCSPPPSGMNVVMLYRQSSTLNTPRSTRKLISFLACTAGLKHTQPLNQTVLPDQSRAAFLVRE